MPILDDIRGLLSNPTVQGIGAAALTGANPLLGLLAAPGIQSDRESRRLENEIRRRALLTDERRAGAQRGIAGLLSSRQTVQGPDRVAALLSPEGGADPVTIPSRRESVSAVETPEGQRRLLALLSQADPGIFNQALSQRLLSSQSAPRETAFLTELRNAGLDPSTGEGRELLLDRLRDDESTTDELLRSVQAQLAAFELEDRRRSRDEEGREERRTRTTRRRETSRNIEQAQKLARLNQRLEGTFLQAGLPASDFRRTSSSAFNAILSGLGVDRSEQEQRVADFDTFRKGLNDIIIDTIDRFGGSLTNDKLALLESASASVDISPQAIASILADITEIHLDGALDDGFDIPDEDGVREFIDEQREFAEGAPDEDVAVDELSDESLMQRLFGGG